MFYFTSEAAFLAASSALKVTESRVMLMMLMWQS